MRLPSIALLLLVLTGCSGLMQNIGARWVTRQLASEFDLDDVQSQATRAAVDRLIAKAPEVIGPPVDVIVAMTDRSIAKGMTDQDLIGIERQVDRLLDEVAGPVIDEAAPILATLTDDQIDHAAARFQKRFDEVREKLARPAAERLEERQDKFIEAVEEWTGTLTDSQERALREHVAGFPDEGAVQLAADEGKIRDIEQVLRQHEGPEAVREALWKAWKERDDWGPNARSPEERRAANRKTLVYIYGMLDAKQRAHASAHLHELHAKVKRFLGLVA